MSSLLSPSMNAEMMRITGGVTVVKGSETTYGTPKGAPIVLLSGQLGGGVLTADDAVVVANGTLTGIGPKTGINADVTVDGTAYKVVGITTPHEAGFMGHEFDGDLLCLLLSVAD